MALYAAYGSNMDPAQMMQRCPASPFSTSGWLTGWRLTFGGEDLGWEGSLTTIVEEPDASVFCVLYDVPPADEKTLDSWEGADIGLYAKIRLRVRTDDGEKLAWLYVLQGYEGGVPSARYLGVIAEAAEIAGAPAEYVAELRSRSCRSISG
ncbi:MAG: gamma-glutamylcyclotransferase family protein [Nakamurella sp.]